MSTWMYLRCLDHDPPLRAEMESGQHTYDLPRIQREISKRDEVVERWRNRNFSNGGVHLETSLYFELHSAMFLSEHPRCSIGIIDEYGREWPVAEADNG